MSIYTTPLHLGYFFSLLLWLIFLIRGILEDRLSDKLLGWLMFILAIEMQDYTFGFSGINFLWNELNGFPRGVSFLFGPVVYFYFLAQTNRSFRFRKFHVWHFAPYLIYFIYHILFFIQGPETVLKVQESAFNDVMTYVLRVCLILSFIYYLRKCLKIYAAYRTWSLEQFSNLEIIDFRWFRNFIYTMILWLFCREFMLILDVLYDLDFYQDWWWNLALVAVAFYIGLAGIAQKQPTSIFFSLAEQDVHPERVTDHLIDLERKELADNLKDLMARDRLYLQANLSLNELAQHLNTSPVLLSAAINQVLGKNFNDYINELRIQAFIDRYYQDKYRKYTLLGLAFDSGFNSKATFNRAFKKIKGVSPALYLKNETSI